MIIEHRLQTCAVTAKIIRQGRLFTARCDKSANESLFIRLKDDIYQFVDVKQQNESLDPVDMILYFADVEKKNLFLYDLNYVETKLIMLGVKS